MQNQSGFVISGVSLYGQALTICANSAHEMCVGNKEAFFFYFDLLKQGHIPRDKPIETINDMMAIFNYTSKSSFYRDLRYLEEIGLITVSRMSIAGRTRKATHIQFHDAPLIVEPSPAILPKIAPVQQPQLIEVPPEPPKKPRKPKKEAKNERLREKILENGWKNMSPDLLIGHMAEQQNIQSIPDSEKAIDRRNACEVMALYTPDEITKKIHTMRKGLAFVDKKRGFRRRITVNDILKTVIDHKEVPNDTIIEEYDLSTFLNK